MRYPFKALLVVLFTLASGLVQADLPVVVVTEAGLPYDYSPSNYENSPNNYDNSVSNYDNSPSNYGNSESNYENSSSNYENSRSGSRRLIYTENGSRTHVGYYVTASNGTTNFFSRSGKRMFYNPKGGRGIYEGRGGSFCGVLAVKDGKYSLVLTENGLKVMFMNN